MTKRDIIIITIIILTAAVGLIFNSKPLKESNQNQHLFLEISVNGNIAYYIPFKNLPEEKTYEITGPLGISRVEVGKAAVRMHHSPCPDEYCMNTGWIEKPGQTIVCIPNRVIIEISAPTKEIDAISK